MKLADCNSLDIVNKTILLRTDYDVPITNGVIVDDQRIKNTLETINFLLIKNCKIIILSHIGRPKGMIVPELSLKPTADRLQQLVSNTKIHFSPQILGPTTQQFVQQLQPKEILILENLRFDLREETNDKEFAKALANLGQVYVNEAFAVSHRNHASIVSIPLFLPHAAGFGFVKEITALNRIKQESEKPIVVVLGGKKQDKLKFLEPLARWADTILVGGLLPRVCGKEGLTEGNVSYATLTTDGKDITLESSERFSQIIIAAKTIVWNGTMDLFEDRHNQAGTRIIATAIVESQGVRYAGGGDTTSAIKQLNLLDKFSFMCSGGGAMLEMLANGTIVGESVLKNYG